mmetsp:Transcript_67978/g.198938  ORF Transcript_67978/g.198938 Transcript_67978/m.198938 type:complete len:108 (-) Transcript_67978:590-913(-)
MDLQWQRTECFLDYQAMLFLNWGSLEGVQERWEQWLRQQGLTKREFMDRLFFRGGAGGLPRAPVPELASREGYRKVARLDADVARLAAGSCGVVAPDVLLEAVEAHA